MSNTVKTFVAEQNVRNTAAKEKKKQVYKHLLDSAFDVPWPRVNATLNASIFAELLNTLAPVGDYRKQVRTLKRQKKKDTLEKPDLFNRLHIGINSVSQYLETFIQNKRLKKPQPHENTTPCIYICKREIKPANLCQHIVYMAAIAHVQLVVLPDGSENKLGNALHISRASVVLIEIIEDKEEKLRLFAKDIPFVDAPWLQNALSQKPHFLTDNVKVLKTEAPIIIKNANNKRKTEQDHSISKKHKK